MPVRRQHENDTETGPEHILQILYFLKDHPPAGKQIETNLNRSKKTTTVDNIFL